MRKDRMSKLFHTLFQGVGSACKKGGFKDDSWKKYASTEKTHIVAGMAYKSNRHCVAAKKLLDDGFKEEAIILLRSAYETTILMDYLYHSGEKNNYLCWSDIVDYRNYSMWPRVSSIDLDTVYDNESPSFGDQLDQMKSNILEELQNNPDIDRTYESKLEQDPEKLLEFKQFHKIVELREKLLEDTGVGANALGHPLIKFQFYRNASTLVHANWNGILRFYLKPKGIQGAEYSAAHCLSALRTISEQNIVDLFGVDLISDKEYGQLYNIVDELRELISKLNPSDK